MNTQNFPSNECKDYTIQRLFNIYEKLISYLKIFWILITICLGQNVDGPETPTMPVKFTSE